MYYYKGCNPDPPQHFEKPFEDEDEAINFARDNAFDYPQYTVKDDDEDIVDSNIMASDEEEATMNDMFPDEDSMEGSDVDDFFENW